MTQPFLPSDSNYHHGMIGNGRTCALVDTDGSIVFACMPDFDSGTVFASLLDKEKGGSFGLEMVGGNTVSQDYERHTNVLVTRYEDGEGSALEVIDFMPRYTWDGKAGSREDDASDIVRVVRALSGSPKLCVHYDPKLEYARFDTTTFPVNGCIKSTSRGVLPCGRKIYESLHLHTDLPHQDVLDSAEIALAPGESRFFLVTYHDKVQVPDHDLINLMLQRTRAYWLLWTARTHRTKRYAEEVLRSALALKMLQFNPTGALLAAATTSLPETIGENRNWDYRFCWIRDGSMTVSTLRRIGHQTMAVRFIDWMLRTVPTKDDHLQIMYGLRGEKLLHEEILDHLSGYLGSAPVRIGNAAYHQEQHDIYGVLLDVIYQDVETRVRTPESLDRIWTRVRSVVRTVADRWREPDRGIWEIRGDTRHFIFSKVLCWVAVDRAIKIARLLNKDAWASEHEPLRDEIHAEICQRGWNAEVGAFTQSYGSTDLDSSNLLMAEYGFLDGQDPQFVSTVRKTKEQLCRDGLLYRYRNHDDFGEPNSAFTVCSFWMVKALAAIGARDEARVMFEDLLAQANPKGLYGEDLDFATRRHLGNFPQAYSHLALIDCALLLGEDENDALIRA
jgi:GH15 family glucan-1,4-alpha-glucosidase